NGLKKQLAHYRESGNAEKIQQGLLRVAAYHEQHGNFTEAVKNLDEYLLARPDDASVITRIIQAYEKLESPNQARQWRLQLARVYRANEDVDREARVLRDVLAKLPEDEEALHMLMNAEFHRNDMQSGVVLA